MTAPDSRPAPQRQSITTICGICGHQHPCFVAQPAPTREAALLYAYQRALADFPTGYDIEGIYGNWKNDLDSALKITDLATTPNTAKD